MAWRFKASKYKNTVTNLPKKEEWISEIPVGNLMQSCGNHIKAGHFYMAFNVFSSGGGNLGLLPVEKTGRVSESLPQILAHADYVTDFEFSPFDGCLIASGSADTTVKVWLLPEPGSSLPESLAGLSPKISFNHHKRVENVKWNPVADGILAATAFDCVYVYDIPSQSQCYKIGNHGDQILSVDWCGDGRTLITSCKDKKIRIVDPRSEAVVQEAQGHANVKDSRSIWLGNRDLILTSGFSSARNRQVMIWDCRNFQTSLESSEYDTSSGILMPLFDPDSSILYLVGKGDTSFRFCEVAEKSPYLTENAVERTEQVKGAALVPKSVLSVMSGEVNRLLLLTKNAIIPMPSIVPRKAYVDFHEDLFPDTASGEPTLKSSSWIQGQNGQIKLMSLDPAKRGPQFHERGHLFGCSLTHSNTSASDGILQQDRSTNVETSQGSSSVLHDNKTDDEVLQEFQTDDNTHNQTDEQKEHIHSSDTANDPSDSVSDNQQPTRAAKTFSVGYQSKFRHIKGKTLHKDFHFTNLRKMNRSLPWESDLFKISSKWCAVPIEGAGGHLAILDLDKPDRLPDASLPTLQHKNKIMDFDWDPFDDSRLAVVCDGARISVWNIPSEGITETTSSASFYLRGHTEKIYFVKFHPLAKDVIMTGSYDQSVRIWDMASKSQKLQLQDHPDQIFCAAWSPDGKYIATVCKDKKIRIFNPRKGPNAIMEGPGPVGIRGARIVWVLDGQYLFVSGFSRSSTRIISLHDTADLSKPLAEEEFSISPAVLVPYYDEGSHVVFLNGRGDGIIFAVEVLDTEPYIFPLESTPSDNQHQALSFLSPFTCDVRKVEIAKAWRLTSSNIEPISFTVPRIRMKYFQDDLYPDISDTRKATMTSEEWFAGKNSQPPKVSLKPSDMKKLSEAPIEAPKVQKYESYNPDTYKTDEQKKEELLSAMSDKLEINKTLPQDLADGVDSDEWEDD